MFWRRNKTRRASQDATNSEGTKQQRQRQSLRPLAKGAEAEPARSYDDVDYWESQRLDPWAASRAIAEQHTQRAAADAARRTAEMASALSASRNAAECVVAPSGAPPSVGFLNAMGLVPVAAFNARVSPADRVVLLVGDGRIPVAFDVRETMAAIGHEGLFRSPTVTCLMNKIDLARVQQRAHAARERETAHLLFRPPRVEAVVDPYGAWGLVAAQDDRDCSPWWDPSCLPPQSGPGLFGAARAPATAGTVPVARERSERPPTSLTMYEDVTPWSLGYLDMYSDSGTDSYEEVNAYL